MTTKLTMDLAAGDVVFARGMGSPQVRVERVEEIRADRIGQRAFHVHGVIVSSGEPHVWWCTDETQFYLTHVTLTVTARDIRAGDVFTLHGHERTATHSTWPTALRNHVHISFVGGGDAVVPADRQLVVTRAQESQCATA